MVKSRFFFFLFALLSFYATAANTPTVTPTVSPSVTPVFTGDSSCRIESEITLSELKQLWGFSSTFQAKELNGLSDTQIAANAKNPTPLGQPLIINNYYNQEPASVPISKLALLLNKKPEEIAAKLGKNPTDLLTKSEAQALAETPEQSNSILGLFGSSVSVKQQPDPVNQYVVKLNSGRVVSLAGLENLRELSHNSCMLDRYIESQVSYFGLADKNYYLGFHRNGQVKQESHISSSTTNAILNLGKDGKNMIVPKFYENTAIFFSTWDTLSTILNWGIAGLGSSTAIDTKEQIDKLEKKQVILNKRNSEVVQSAQATSFLEQRRNSALDELSHLTQGTDDYVKVQNKIKGYDKNLANLDNEIASIGEDVQKNSIASMDATEKELAKLKKVSESRALLGQRAAARSIIFGFGFLGPARFFYSINEALIFSSNSFNDNDYASLKNNYIKVYAKNEVLKEFRYATNNLLLGLGGIEELVAGSFNVGVPADAFSTGPMYVINEPSAPDSTSNTVSSEVKGTSYSSFSKGAHDSWIVKTGWQGKSDFQTLEKITPFSDYARVALEANQLPPNILLNRKDFQKTETIAMALAIPFMFRKAIPQLSSRLVNLLPLLLSTNLVLAAGVDQYKVNQFKCNENDIQTYKNWYIASVLLDSGINFYLPELRVNVMNSWRDQRQALITSAEKAESSVFTQLFSKSGAKYTGTIGAKTALNLLSYTSPFQMTAWYASSAMQQYASTCYDQQYTITSWQTLKGLPDASSTSKLSDVVKPLKGIFDKTPLASLFSNNTVELQGRDELINFKAAFDNQESNLELKDLYYMHVDFGSSQAHGVLNQVDKKNNSCFENLVGNGNVRISAKDGIQLKDKNGNIIANFNSDDWKKRAAFAKDDFDHGRTIIPNKLVSFKLTCPNPFIISSSGKIQGNPSCPEVACLFNVLSSMTGRNSQDLNDYLGKTRMVYTSEGAASFNDKYIRFAYSVEKKREDVVKVDQPKVLEEYKTDKGIVRKVVDPLAVGGTKLVMSTVQGLINVVKGDTSNDSEAINPTRDSQEIIPEISSPGTEVVGRDGTGSLVVGGKVYLNGYVNNPDKEESLSVGGFETLISSNARMEYDSATGRVYLAFYVLGGALPGSVKSVEVSNSKNVESNGKPAESIKIDKVNAVTGGNEEEVAKLNAALKQLQQKGGFQMFETEKYLYYFTTDDKGNSILRICDKAIGTCRDVPITGVSKDGNNITVQTPEGNYKFNFGADQRGNPTLQVDGPNGFQDFSKLLSARAPGGILVFDPNTGWQLLNAQDIPWDKKFQQNGVSFYANPDGSVKGVPDTNLLGNQQTQTPDIGSSLIANLPGVPSSVYGLIAFIVTLTTAVIVIRLKK